MSQAVLRARDQRRGTYRADDSCGPLLRYLAAPDIALLTPQREPLAAVTGHWLEHRFDLLGSGWVQVCHGMCCRGLEGHRYQSGPVVQPDHEGLWLAGRVNASNLPEAQRIWQLVDAGYVPIDWHLDFKSGYRWREDTWHADIRFGHRPGVDVKVPWELARMQHLPQLAWAYALAAAGDAAFAAPAVYAREFRNQVVDFLATNPPRFGVNWRCPMDVAIRAANWLVAYDLFRALGVEFDPSFQRVFARAVVEHGRHVVDHLEWYGGKRGNHYLADIAGLLFVAGYLPCASRTDAWLALAVQELVSEVEFQFHPEGTHFEASTSYHRLSAEMVAYATALVLGLPAEKQVALQQYNCDLVRTRPRLRPAPLVLHPLPGSRGASPFPRWYLERLEKMAEFTIHVTKPNGMIHQVGDNDSGRFLKLQPVWRRRTVAEAKSCYYNLEGYGELPDEATYWDEDRLDHRELVAAIAGLFCRPDLNESCGVARLDTTLVRQWAGHEPLPSYLAGHASPAATRTHIPEQLDVSALLRSPNNDLLRECKECRIPPPDGDLLSNMCCYGYADFGLFIFRSPRLYLAVRCGRHSRRLREGHAHHDQLAVELQVDGLDWEADCGSYLYTPSPMQRNLYRSAAAHNVPRVVQHLGTASVDGPMFGLHNMAWGVCLVFEPYRFVGRLQLKATPVYRVVEIDRQSVRILDLWNGPLVFDFPKQYSVTSGLRAKPPISEGYGNQRVDRTCSDI